MSDVPASRRRAHRRVTRAIAILAPLGALLLGALLLGAPLARGHAADTVTVTIRSGNHPDFGRMVFDAPPRVAYRVERDGDRLTVRFADDVSLTGDPKLPRNVAALQAERTQAVLTVAAGTTFHDARLGDHVVIDVFDAAPQKASGTPGADTAPPAGHTLASPAARPPAASSTPASSTPASSTPTSSPPAARKPPATTQPVRGTAKPQPPAPPQHPAATAAAATTAATPVAPAATMPGTAFGPPPSGNLANPVAEPLAEQRPADMLTLVAVPVTLPAETKGSAFALPFDASVGAAAFRRGNEALVVFDSRRPVDLTALPAGSAPAGTRVELLPSGTLLHMTPPPGTAVALSRTPQGWIVAVLETPPQPQPFVPAPTSASLGIPAREPGGVLAIADPVTGGTLLVGTQRQPGQAMLIARHSAQFVLLPTMQGVVAAPLADTVSLRAVADGFSLSTAPDPLALSVSEPASLGNAATLTHRFEFSSAPAAQLVRQLSVQTAEAAAEPLLARGTRRRDAAITMISLGMDAEAEALLRLAAADDPRQAASADVLGLTAIAAILAGRPAEAEGIDDPHLTGTDEVVLWRALRIAMQDNTSPTAAIALSSSAALLLTYPPAIRDRILPLAAETMVQGGATAAATALLAHADDAPGLDLARAMLAQAAGETDAALSRYDALASGHDQMLRSRAAVRAVELRLARGKFDTRQAAEALDRLLYAWRGDRRELALREKLAGLRQQLGEWRAALALLRDSETAFPDDAKEIRGRLQGTFDALLHDDAADKLPPLEFVALVDENADLVPNTRKGEAMQAILADKLVALDLPKRAAPVLDKLMRAMPAGAGRAAFGARLATLRLGESDAGGALAALVGSDAPDLPAALAEQRTLLRASGLARWGDVAGAISVLAGLDSTAAGAARADILEQAKDWVGADRALAALVTKTVPDTGELDDNARRSLLRLATAAARAGDETTLASLREHQDARMGTGPLADMFRLLTADPVHGTADLPRAGREVGFVKALPADLQAMRP